MNLHTIATRLVSRTAANVQAVMGYNIEIRIQDQDHTDVLQARFPGIRSLLEVTSELLGQAKEKLKTLCNQEGRDYDFWREPMLEDDGWFSLGESYFQTR